MKKKPVKKIILLIIAIAALIYLVPWLVDKYTTTNLGAGVLTLGTTTDLEKTGLLAALHPDFEEKTKIQVDLIAMDGEGAAKKALNGEVDALLVPESESVKQLMAQYMGINKQIVLFTVKGLPDSEGTLPKQLISRTPYYFIAVNPEEHPQVNQNNAAAYQTWITAKETQKTISVHRKDGKKPIFTQEDIKGINELVDPPPDLPIKL